MMVDTFENNLHRFDYRDFEPLANRAISEELVGFRPPALSTSFGTWLH